MNTNALRQKILDLAIRGKLVPQDPSDEPASVLFERIRAQKQQMVREGKLKAKDIAGDSIIYVGDDNLHYEKFSDGSVKCIEEEIPFEVPEGWAWARLTSILEVFITGPFGSSLHKSDYVDGGTPLINPMNIVDGKIEPNAKMLVSSDTVKRLSSFAVQPADIVIARRGEMGRCAVVTDSESGWLCGTGSFVLRLINTIDASFIVRYISSPNAIIYLAGNSIGNTMPNLNQAILRSMLIPTPPFKEQLRIVQQLCKTDMLIDKVARHQSALADLIISVKSKILNLAIRGQLVPQDPADEPASVLLERIRTEKESLIKQGKIKRDKKESVIFRGDDNSYYLYNAGNSQIADDILPYELPDSWCWCTINDVFSINPRNHIDDETEVSFVPMPLIADGFSNHFTCAAKRWKEVKSGFTHFQEGDIGLAKITPCFENRKSVVFTSLTNAYGAGTTELHILRPLSVSINAEYALWFLKSERFIQDGVQSFTGAVGQQRIGRDVVANTFFPLPPIKEQNRIAEMIRMLFHRLDKIACCL